MKIISYIKSKTTSNSSSGGTSNISNTLRSNVLSTLEPHEIWGQTFTGTNDVKGDIDVQGDINNAYTINARNINISNDASLTNIKGGKLNVSGDSSFGGKVGIESSGSLVNEGKTYLNNDVYITAPSDTKTIVPNLNDTYDLGSTEKFWANIYGIDGWFTNLDVTGQAHFKEVVIDKIKATGGNIIVSPGSFHVDKVETIKVDGSDTEVYPYEWTEVWEAFSKYLPQFESMDTIFLKRCLQLKYDDKTGKEKRLEFSAGDIVYCQAFGIGTGTTYDATTKYFRTPVYCVGETSIDGVYYNYITIFSSYKTETDSTEYGVWNEGNVKVEEGDDFVMLGSYNSDNQNAIIISAVQGLDNTVKSPSIVQYKGISTYTCDISDYKITQITPSGNIFKGTLKVDSGKSVQELIDDISVTQITYTYIAYASSITYNDDGTVKTVDGTKTPVEGVHYNYLGVYTGFIEEKYTDLRDYKWTPTNGDESDVSFRRMQPVKNTFIVNTDDSVSYDFRTKLFTVVNDTLTEITSNDEYEIKATLDSGNFPVYNSLDYDSTLHCWVLRGTLPDTYSSAPNYTSAIITLYHTPEGESDTALETYNVPLVSDAGAYLEVSDQIKAYVQDTSLNLERLTLRADGLTNQVSDASSRISQLEIRADRFDSSISDLSTNFHTEILQTTNEIKLEIDSSLQSTGIDITNGLISLDGEHTVINGDLTIDSDNNANALTLLGDDDSSVVVLKNTTIFDEDSPYANPDEIGHKYDYSTASSGRNSNTSADSYYGSAMVFENLESGQTISIRLSQLVYADFVGSNGVSVDAALDSDGNTTSPKTSIKLILSDGSTETVVKTLDDSATLHTYSFSVPKSKAGCSFILRFYWTPESGKTYSWRGTSVSSSRGIKVYARYMANLYGAHVTAIGQDGICTYIGTDKFVFNTDGMDLKWGYDGIYVDDDGYQRYGKSHSGDLVKCASRYNILTTATTSLVLTDYLNYDYFVFTGGTAKTVLLSNSNTLIPSGYHCKITNKKGAGTITLSDGTIDVGSATISDGVTRELILTEDNKWLVI